MLVCLAWFCVEGKHNLRKEWEDDFRSAGHDVVWLEQSDPYDATFARLARSLPVVGLVDYGISAGTQWFAVLKSAVIGRDVHDGSRPDWPPNRTWLWWADSEQPPGSWWQALADLGAIELPMDARQAIAAALADL